MTDERRPTAREVPDSPDSPRSEPHDPDQEEFSRPDGDEFDGGRGGVTPEFPGEERAAPDGVPETDAPRPDDPGAAAIDDHVAGQAGKLVQEPIEDFDRGVEREDLSAPNQGFRPGG